MTAKKRKAEAAVAHLAPRIDESKFPLMGKQLTTQYNRAISGMAEVLRLGCMMKIVREQVGEVGGRGKKGGLSEWLKKYAPDVKYATAYRFMSIADKVEQSYVDVVGTRTANKFSMAALVTAKPGEMNQSDAKKLQALFDLVAGTSQRFWLADCDPRGTTKRGGDTTKDKSDATRKAKQLAYTEELEKKLKGLRQFVFNQKRHNFLDAGTKETACTTLKDIVSELS